MRQTYNSATALALVMTLSACGGGGGGGGGVNSAGTAAPSAPVISAPTPTPAPAPAPTPTPIPPPAVSAEYAASAAVIGSKAKYAYDNGYTGQGVTIAIVDTGIDKSNSEFASRISADSRAFENKIARCMTCAPETVTFDLQDVMGHGTATASVAAGAKDGKGMQGLAPNANILALKVAAANLDGVTSDSVIKEGSGVNTYAIAPAVAYAVQKGAFVISMSLNGTANGDALVTDLRNAMDSVRMNDRLVVQSVSNFSNDNSFTGQIAEAMVGGDLANKEWFLFGIRVDSQLRAPASNGVPGALADRTLSVVADYVDVAQIGGGTAKETGNSFAAPAIAGAAALLKQRWPQLGGKAIARILLDTAADLGEKGPDQTYGVGLMNVEEAMRAQAPTLGLSSAAAPVANSSLIFSSAFGGGSGAATFSSFAGNAVVLDKYGRDYTVNVAGLTGSRVAQRMSIYGAVASPVARAWTPIPHNQASALVSNDQATTAHPLTSARPASFGFRLSPTSYVVGQTGSSVEGSSLVTGSMLRSFGLATQGTSASLETGGYSYTVANATTNVRGSRSATSSFRLAMPFGISFGISNSRETGSALGMRGTGAFSISGANTSFATMGWTGDFAGLHVTSEAMVGRTKVATRSELLAFSPVVSSGFRLQTDHGLFGGTATLGMTSPLKVESAKVRYTAPVAYDLATQSLVSKSRTIDLAPNSREMNLELGWKTGFGASTLGFGAAYGFNAGNQAGLSSAGGWLRLSKQL